MKKPPFVLVILSLLLILQNVNAQPSKVDSVLAMPLDSILSWMDKNYNSDIDNYEEIVKKSIMLAQKSQNNEKIGDTHTAFATWLGYHGFKIQDSLILQSELALKYYTLTKNKEKIAKAHKVLAMDYINDRRIADGEAELFKAVAIYEELQSKEGIANTQRALANAYLITEEPENALKYLNMATPVLRELEDYNTVSYAYLGYIEAYNMTGEIDKALQAANECLQLVKDKVPEEVFVEVRAYTARGRAYMKAQDYTQALKDFQKAYDLCVIQVGEERSATYLTEVGDAYLSLGNYPKALENILAGVKGYGERFDNNFAEYYDNIALCYFKMGEHKNAYLYKEKATKAMTYVHNERVAALESEGVIKYETGKKDEALASQKELLSQKSKTQNITLAALGVLALFLAGLFYALKKNQKAKNLIAAKNAENELLLKEIHHRVKNNLEMVKSLIALQSAELEDSVTKDAMIASQNRVQSMGIIHQKLYQGTNLGSIEMKDYFINLSEGILDSFNAEDKVKIECAMDDLELDVDTAVPIGLIVNELLTNALKYAFPDKEEGNIKISMSREQGKIIKLNVTDNGIGKTVGLKPQGTGFGSRLVQLLTQQLNGEMQEKNEEGTVISFTFKLDQAA